MTPQVDSLRARLFTIVRAALAFSFVAAVVIDGPVLAATALERAAERESVGDTAGAVAVLEEAIARSPDDPAAYNQLAILFVRRGDLDRAAALLADALQTDPTYADVYHNLQAVLGALAARAYASALDEPQAASPPLELAAVSPRIAAVAPSADGASAAAPMLVAAVPASRAPAPAQRPPAPAQRAPAPASRAPAPAPVAAPVTAAPVTAAAAPPAAATTSRPAPVVERRPPPAPEPDRAPVEAAVRAWARAWSEQDVDAYLGFYAAEFAPARGLSRDAWRAQRVRRIGAPKYIEIDVTDLDIRFDGEARATVRFSQRYRSDRLRSTVVKVLAMRYTGDRWQIARERVR